MRQTYWSVVLSVPILTSQTNAVSFATDTLRICPTVNGHRCSMYLSVLLPPPDGFTSPSMETLQPADSRLIQIRSYLNLHRQ